MKKISQTNKKNESKTKKEVSQFFCKKYFVLRSNSRSNITCFFNTVRLKRTFQNVCVINFHDSRYFHFLKHNLIPPFWATFFPNSLSLSLAFYLSLSKFLFTLLKRLQKILSKWFWIQNTAETIELKEIERILCEKNFIQYFLLAGRIFVLFFVSCQNWRANNLIKGHFRLFIIVFQWNFLSVLFWRLHDLFNISDNFKSFE